MATNTCVRPSQPFVKAGIAAARQLANSAVSEKQLSNPPSVETTTTVPPSQTRRNPLVDASHSIPAISHAAVSSQCTQAPSWVYVRDSVRPPVEIDDLITQWYNSRSDLPPFTIYPYALQYITSRVSGRPPQFVHNTHGPLLVTVYAMSVPAHIPEQGGNYIAVAHSPNLDSSIIAGRVDSDEYWIWEVAPQQTGRWERSPSIRKIAAADHTNYPDTRLNTNLSTAESGQTSTPPAKQPQFGEAKQTLSSKDDQVNVQYERHSRQGFEEKDIVQNGASPSQQTPGNWDPNLASNHQVPRPGNTASVEPTQSVPSLPVASANVDAVIRRQFDRWYAAKGSHDTPPCAISQHMIPYIHCTRDGQPCVYIHKPSGLALSVEVVQVPEVATMIPAPTRTHVIIAKATVHDEPVVIGVVADTGPVDVWKGLGGNKDGWELVSSVKKILYMVWRQSPVHPTALPAARIDDTDGHHQSQASILTRESIPLHRPNGSATAFWDDTWLQDAKSLRWWPKKGVEKEPLDLGELKRLVLEKGGPERVKWVELGRQMGYDSDDWQTTYVRKRYDRWIRLYDHYLREKTTITQQHSYSAIDGSILPSAILRRNMSDRAALGPVLRAALDATMAVPTMPGPVTPSPAPSVPANFRRGGPVSASARPGQVLAASGPSPSPDASANSETLYPTLPQPPAQPPAVPDQVPALSGHAPIIPGPAPGTSDLAPPIPSPTARSAPSSKAPSLASTSSAALVAPVSAAAPVDPASNSAPPSDSATTPPKPALTMAPTPTALVPTLNLTPDPPLPTALADSPATTSVAAVSPPVVPASSSLARPSALSLLAGVPVAEEHHRTLGNASIPSKLPSPDECSSSTTGVKETGDDILHGRTMPSKSPSPILSSSRIPGVTAAADGILECTKLPSQPASSTSSSSSTPGFTDTLKCNQTEKFDALKTPCLVPPTSSATHAASASNINPSGEKIPSRPPPPVPVPSASSPLDIMNAVNDNMTGARISSDSTPQVLSLSSAPIVTEMANINPTGILNSSVSSSPVLSRSPIMSGLQAQRADSQSGVLDALKPTSTIERANSEAHSIEKPPLRDDFIHCTIPDNIRELITEWCDRHGASYSLQDLPCASIIKESAFAAGLSGSHVKWEHDSGEDLTVKMFYLAGISEKGAPRLECGRGKSVIVARGTTVPPFIIAYRGYSFNERTALLDGHSNIHFESLAPYKAWVGVSGDMDGFEALASVTKYYNRPDVRRKQSLKRPLPTTKKTGPTKSPAAGTPRKLQDSTGFIKERLRPPRIVRYADIFDVESSEEYTEEDSQDDEEDSEEEETDEHDEEEQEECEEDGHVEEEESGREQLGKKDDQEDAQAVDWKERAVEHLEALESGGTGLTWCLRTVSELLEAEGIDTSYDQIVNFWYHLGGKELVKNPLVRAKTKLSNKPIRQKTTSSRKIVRLKIPSVSRNMLREQEDSPIASPPAANTRKHKRVENEVEHSTEHSIMSRRSGIAEDTDALASNSRKRTRLEHDQALPAQVLDPPLSGLYAQDLTVPAANARKRIRLGSDHENHI